MDGNQARREDRQALKRIVAMLFSLAGLAELACHRSAPVRGFVLWVLRIAENYARGLVEDTAWDLDIDVSIPSSVAIPALHASDSTDDALRLAHTFRTLAMLLEWLADRDVVLRKLPATMEALATITRILAEPMEPWRPRLAAVHAIGRLDSS